MANFLLIFTSRFEDVSDITLICNAFCHSHIFLKNAIKSNKYLQKVHGIDIGNFKRQMY